MDERPKLLASAWKKSPLAVVGLVVTMLALLSPIWVGRYLPLLDYPGHLASLFRWRHLHDPALGFDHFYESNLQPIPYWVQYGAEYLLAIPFGEEIAQKLFLSLAIGLFPLSVAVYAKQLGRDPWLGILAAPLAWNMNTSHGFLAYIGGIPLLFFALTALDRFATAPSWKRGLLTLSLGVSLYFSHVLIWGAFLFVGACTALLAARPLTLRKLLSLPLVFVPVLLVGVWAQTYGDADKTNLPVSGKGFGEYEGAFNTFFQNIEAIPDWTLNTLPEPRDEHLYSALLLLCWLLLLVTGWRSVSTDAVGAPPVGYYARLKAWLPGKAGVSLFIIALLYFSLPRSLLRPFYWYAINRRLAVLMAAFAVLLIKGPLLRTKLRRTLLLAAMVLSTVYSLDISAHFVRFNRRNHVFEELLAQVPKHKTVLPLMFSLGDPDSLMNCFNQWGSYLQIQQGGYMTQYFPIEFPLRRRRVQTPHAPAWDSPHDFRFAQHAAGWDYLLLHGRTRNPELSGRDPRLRLVDRRGDWALFENMGPR